MKPGWRDAFAQEAHFRRMQVGAETVDSTRHAGEASMRGAMPNIGSAVRSSYARARGIA